jgi:hypothetical protein
LRIDELKIGEKYDAIEFLLNKAFPVTPLAKGNSVQNFSVGDESGAWIRAAHFRVSDENDLTKYPQGTPLLISKAVIELHTNPKNPTQSYPAIIRCEVKILDKLSETTKETKKEIKKESKSTKDQPGAEIPGTSNPFAGKDDNIVRQSSVKAAVELVTSDAFKEGTISISDVLTIAELIRGYVFKDVHPEIEEKVNLIKAIELELANQDFKLDIKPQMLFTGSVTFLRDVLQQMKK